MHQEGGIKGNFICVKAMTIYVSDYHVTAKGYVYWERLYN